MNHFTVPSFWKTFYPLEKDVKKTAYKSKKLLIKDPFHNSLQFKKVGRKKNKIGTYEEVWSVRVGLHYRALSFKKKNEFYWYWIGSHTNYDKIIKLLK